MHANLHTNIYVIPMWRAHLRILSVFLGPPKATQMTGSGKPADTPHHVLQLALGNQRSVSARPLGEEERRGSCSRQEKDEEGFRHDRRFINHKIPQTVFIAADGGDRTGIVCTCA